MVGVDGSSPFAPTKYARPSFGVTGILFLGRGVKNHDRSHSIFRDLTLAETSAILFGVVDPGAITLPEIVDFLRVNLGSFAVATPRIRGTATPASPQPGPKEIGYEQQEARGIPQGTAGHQKVP